MSIRDQFKKLLDRKEQEIIEIELQLEKAKTYVQAIQDSMRLLPKDSSEPDMEQMLRPGTALARSREVLKSAGRPMHITEILKAINQPLDKNHKISLSGSLSAYVRNGQIFTRPAPNTFGLLDMGKASSGFEDAEIPEDFGDDK